jgi:hypothetical protein
VKPGDLQGYGQTFVLFEQQKLDWSDLLGLIMLPSDDRDLNVWPAQPTDFSKTAARPKWHHISRLMFSEV